MSNVFPRNCKANLPLAVQGDGVYIIDSTGKQYIDASGGAAVSCLGHSNARVIDAIKSQLDRLAFAHTGFFSSVPAEALAELLIQHAPGSLDRV
jgi:adenosylmethionine-8-amino-7-oxononanoate aminotransferase